MEMPLEVFGSFKFFILMTWVFSYHVLYNFLYLFWISGLILSAQLFNRFRKSFGSFRIWWSNNKNPKSMVRNCQSVLVIFSSYVTCDLMKVGHYNIYKQLRRKHCLGTPTPDVYSQYGGLRMTYKRCSKTLFRQNISTWGESGCSRNCLLEKRLAHLTLTFHLKKYPRKKQ